MPGSLAGGIDKRTSYSFHWLCGVDLSASNRKQLVAGSPFTRNPAPVVPVAMPFCATARRPMSGV